jgi:DNA-binding CsgD family transcriptional regulator/PAS domain-containing protein
MSLDMIPPSLLSELIGSIYDCALDPGLWEPTLTQLVGAFASQSAVLGLTDLGRRTAMISRIVGMEPRWQRELERHGPEIHAFTARAFPSQQSLDEPFVISRQLSAEYCAGSPYIQECLKPQGLVDVVQLMVISTPTRLAGLGFGRSQRHGHVTEREIGLARLLLPHLRRAITITDVLDATAIARERTEQAFDLFRCAVILTDAQGAIVFANRAALALLQSGDVVQDRRGILQTTLPSAASELRAAIALAGRQEADLGKIGLAIRLTDDDPPTTLAHVLPLTGSHMRASLQPAAVAAVFIQLPGIYIEPALDIVARLYKLTASEVRVLQAIVDTGGVPDIAEALGVSESTVRTHLKRLFEKTSTHRQVDLVKLVAAHVSPFS